MARLGTARCALAACAGALLVLLCSGCGSGITSTSRVAGLPPASLFAGPAPGGPMQSVTCVNDSECWAVGGSAIGAVGSRALIESYNGNRWALASGPGVSSAPGGVLFGVSCATAGDCWAVGTGGGDGGRRLLMEHYTTSGWSLADAGGAGADPGRESALYGVRCVAIDDCWAVGSAGTSPAQSLIQHYDGSRWVSTVSAASAPGITLYGVTCISASNCWAVGSTSTQHTLAAHYDGHSWTVVPSQDPGMATSATLIGVACTKAGDCWAVGSSGTGAVRAPLIERSAGSDWTIVGSPLSVFSKDSSLTGVACASNANCWAVGVVRSAASDQSLAEQYNGTRWAVISSSAVNRIAGAAFGGVSCPSNDDCWVVGSCAANATRCGGSASLIELYDTVLPDGH